MHRIKLILFSCWIFSFNNLIAQTCDTASLITLETRAKDTDTNIDWEVNKHFSFYNPSCTSRNTLVLHLVGSYDNPSSTLLFPSMAANNGFDVVSLKYPNSTTAYSTCNASSDINCYINFRKEIIEGVDYSTEVVVDAANCINNRLIKFLQYLDTTYPSQNWGSYFSGNTINWNQIIVSGHSQGGGHAAVLGITNPVKRVLMFAAPNDYSTFFTAPAQWTTLTHVAEDSAYYGFNNINDDVVNFSEQFLSWNNLGMTSFGDTVYVDDATYPYANSHQLYTDYDTTGIGGTHSVMLLDSKTPVDNSGTPIFEPVWKYMLGITPTPSGIENNKLHNEILIYPNPSNERVKIVVTESAFATLYNLLGKEVLQTKLTESENSINLKQIPTGTYILQLEMESGSVVSKKIVIQN